MSSRETKAHCVGLRSSNKGSFKNFSLVLNELRKQKGDLNNHRGVFIINISSLLFEKLLKNRILPILNKNVSVPNWRREGQRCYRQSILRGIVDHSKYLGKELCITFYDTEKCFDSLWLTV